MFTAQDLLSHWRRQSKSALPPCQPVPFPLKHGVTWLSKPQFQKMLDSKLEVTCHRAPVYVTAKFLHQFYKTEQYDHAWILTILRNHLISTASRYAPTTADFFLHEVYRDLGKGLSLESDPWRLLRANIIFSTGIKLNHPRPNSLDSWIEFLEIELAHQYAKNQLGYAA